MFYAVLGAIALIAAAYTIGKEPPIMSQTYPLSNWRPVVDAVAIPEAVKLGLDPLQFARFAMEWIKVESGGKPCAVGKLTSHGPDGEPRELGLFQIYNPDDLVRLKISSKALRAYCVPGSQECSRPLTADEMRYQVDSGIKLISWCVRSARNTLAANGASWGEKDMYRACKLVHGLPGILKSGIPATKKKLGHAPHSWSEFRATLANVVLDAGTEKYRSSFDRILDNAEKTTEPLVDRGVV